MRDLFEVRSHKGAHPVRVADEALAEIVAGCAPSVVLADAFFRGALAGIDAPILFIEAVETSKDMTEMPALIEACRAARLTREGMIVAVGGGIVQDIACFVASVYMRGVRWTYLPTTLLAMVDSCIGGKSSINVAAYKNLVGTFYPPAAVIAAPRTIATLPPEHVAAGHAEAAKICFAHGDAMFDAYLALDRGATADPAALVELSLGAKKWFVETDEFDRGERLLLNFGHSFGHAIESCSGYAVPHGVGVGVGCLAAVAMSRAARPHLADVRRVGALDERLVGILAPVEGLADALEGVGRDEFFHYWNSDKKHSASHYRPILLDADGHLYRDALPRDAHVADRIWGGFAAARDAVAALAG